MFIYLFEYVHQKLKIKQGEEGMANKKNKQKHIGIRKNSGENLNKIYN